jgi:hypothetical protein
LRSSARRAGSAAAKSTRTAKPTAGGGIAAIAGGQWRGEWVVGGESLSSEGALSWRGAACGEY